MTTFFQIGHAREAARRHLTSVTRWLLVVAGCTGLELVQPALAAEPESAPASAVPAAADHPQLSPTAARGDDTLLYPADGDNRSRGGVAAPADQLHLGWVVAGLLLAGGGAWVWFQKRSTTGRIGSGKLIAIEETKSLGNRQFLVVAKCDGRRLLLGVSPGRIAALADLDDYSNDSFAAKPEVRA